MGGKGSSVVSVCCSLSAEAEPAEVSMTKFEAEAPVDFSIADRQISKDLSMLTLPVGSRFLLIRAVDGKVRV